MHKVIKRVRESGSIANTRICFEVRAHSSTSPPSHRRISTNLSTQDSHKGNLHWGFGVIQLGVHNSSLNQYNLSQRQCTTNTKTTSHKRGRHLANTNQPLARGIGHKATTPTINLYTRGISQIKEGLQLGSFHNHKLSVSHKIMILIDRIDR